LLMGFPNRRDCCPELDKVTFGSRSIHLQNFAYAKFRHRKLKVPDLFIAHWRCADNRSRRVHDFKSLTVFQGFRWKAEESSQCPQ
jgi:hypothetical protein